MTTEYINTDGACSRCGKCCEGIIFPAGGVNTGFDWAEYYYHHGCIILSDVGLWVPSPCPHLKKDYVDGVLECTCDIYAKRPNLCHLDRETSHTKHWKPKGCTV